MQTRIVRGCTHYTVEVQTPFKVDEVDLGYLGVALISSTDLPNGLHIGQRRTFRATWNSQAFRDHNVAEQRKLFSLVMHNFETELFKGLSEYDAISDSILKKQTSWTKYLEKLAKDIEFFCFFNLELIDIVELHNLTDQEITDKSLEICQHVDDPSYKHLFPEPVPQIYRCTSQLDDIIPTYEETLRTSAEGFRLWITPILSAHLEDQRITQEFPATADTLKVIEPPTMTEQPKIEQEKRDEPSIIHEWIIRSKKLLRITPALLSRLGVFPSPCHEYHRMSRTHRDACEVCWWIA